MEKVLSDTDLQRLRRAGEITGEEIALSVGDVVIAENIITKDRRVLDSKKLSLILESSRTLLKG